MGTVEGLDDWLLHTEGAIGMDRRIFLAVSGAPLTTPAWEYVDQLATRGASIVALADERRSITVTSARVDTVAATTAAIRHLGNVEGENADNLRFVHHHLTWVAKLVRQATFTSAAVADRLLAEWAQLAQVAAWMANDARQYGLSQRYFISGLRAAHTAGDRWIGTLLLAEMSQARVHQGRLDDGVDLGRAARDAMGRIGAAVARMKPTAFLINSARGDVVDQAALIAALRSGTIAGAGLDVYEAEPNIPPELLELDNAVLLPHLGSATLATRTAMGMLVLDNLQDFLAGREPSCRVA